MRQPKTKTYAILMNGVERFQIEAIGQFTAIHKALDDPRFHAFRKQQPNVCFMVTAVEVPSATGEVAT
ncbi:hypothetical protein [Tumebacillus permanentifrigoris]|uniref:Uncharacterized protein n=1 Tax=Tumebacillus permanentifrigoris TaxID=378543 RepID=A0A316DSF4_9BACL|nr:hypothetical protein [Tumebacillus permanentifrigoris]PWK08475.1 hypothetical protein C7459_115135 [Tumebacillus permanentifrigoris]